MTTNEVATDLMQTQITYISREQGRQAKWIQRLLDHTRCPQHWTVDDPEASLSDPPSPSRGDGGEDAAVEKLYRWYMDRHEYDMEGVKFMLRQAYRCGVASVKAATCLFCSESFVKSHKCDFTKPTPVPPPSPGMSAEEYRKERERMIAECKMGCVLCDNTAWDWKDHRWATRCERSFCGDAFQQIAVLDSRYRAQQEKAAPSGKLYRPRVEFAQKGFEEGEPIRWFDVQIDRKRYQLAEGKYAGLYLRQLAKIEDDRAFWKIEPGANDRAVADDEMLVIDRDGFRFFSTPRQINAGIGKPAEPNGEEDFCSCDADGPDPTCHSSHHPMEGAKIILRATREILHSCCGDADERTTKLVQQIVDEVYREGVTYSRDAAIERGRSLERRSLAGREELLKQAAELLRTADCITWQGPNAHYATDNWFANRAKWLADAEGGGNV